MSERLQFPGELYDLILVGRNRFLLLLLFHKLFMFSDTQVTINKEPCVNCQYCLFVAILNKVSGHVQRRYGLGEKRETFREGGAKIY